MPLQFRPLHAAKRPFPLWQHVLFAHLFVSWARPTEPSSRKSAKKNAPGRFSLKTKKSWRPQGVCSVFCEFFRFLAPRGVCFDRGVDSVLYGMWDYSERYRYTLCTMNSAMHTYVHTIYSTMISVALLSCSVSSISECPRIK